MPDPTLPPALTPEEWQGCLADRSRAIARPWTRKTELADVQFFGQEGIRASSAVLNEVDIADPGSRHALAALCLYDQSFGFAQEDVDLLQSPHNDTCSMWWLSDYSGAQSCTCGGDARLTALADRIQALLPPPPDAR